MPRQPSPPPDSSYQNLPPASTENGLNAAGTASGVKSHKVKGKVQVQVGACTKMACSEDNPCCNRCQSEVFLVVQESEYPGDFLGKTVSIQNHACEANECGQLTNCEMSHGQDVTLEHVGSMSCVDGQNCSALLAYPLGEGAEHLRSSDAPSTPGIALTGKILSNSTCTLMGCPADKPCCNACTPMVSIAPLSGLYKGKNIMLEGHGCSADGCGKLQECSLRSDSIVTLPNVVVTSDASGNCTGVVQN